jgi:hypothetical protein
MHTHINEKKTPVYLPLKEDLFILKDIGYRQGESIEKQETNRYNDKSRFR